MQANAFGSRHARRPVSYPFHPIVFIVAALSALTVGCKETPRQQRAAPVVSTDSAKTGPLPFVITANGEVEPNRTVAVQSQVSGMLTRVAIAEGDEVSQGQLLFQIDPRPFEAEVNRVQSTLARDQATLVRARADSARFAALAKDGYVTRQQLDQTFAEAGALAATVAAGQASLEAARLDLANTTVRAPIAGRTGQLAIKAGNLVRANSEPPLVTINELRPVLVRFNVPERDFEEMRRRAGLDKPLNVKVTPTVGDTARTVMGTLTFIDNVVDRATGSVLLKARVANESRDLWPGQFVTVGLEISVDQGAVTVPTVAIVTTTSGAYVYVLDDSSKARRVAVKIGRQAGAVTKVDSGLTGGEQVIVEGQSRLTDGAKVELRSAAAARLGAGGARGRGGRGGDSGTGAGNARGGRAAGGDSASGARRPGGL
jgi:membrane fusion protein, multidrug efflux system